MLAIILEARTIIFIIKIEVLCTCLKFSNYGSYPAIDFYAKLPVFLAVIGFLPLVISHHRIGMMQSDS